MGCIDFVVYIELPNTVNISIVYAVGLSEQLELDKKAKSRHSIPALLKGLQLLLQPQLLQPQLLHPQSLQLLQLLHPLELL